MDFGFENLEVYQLAIEFANRVFSLTVGFSIRVQSSLGDQFRRAAISIPNNIAEGSGKVSAKEKKQFYSYALNSTSECIPIMTIAERQRELSDKDHDYLRETCSRLHKMLIKLIKSVDKTKTENVQR